MIRHLRNYVIGNRIHHFHGTVSILYQEVIVESFSCTLMPEITAEVWHHDSKVNSFLCPHVHTVHYKAEAEVMHGGLVAAPCMRSEIPETIEHRCNG